MAREDRQQRVWGAQTATQRQSERRERLMTAAIEEYGRRGFRNTSVKAVCAAAGLTERYFYETFTNGEDALRQCFQQVTRELLDRMRQAARADGRRPLARVRAALMVYLQQLQENPQAARVFLTEMASVSPAAEALVSASLDEFGAQLLNILHPGESYDAGREALLLKGVVGGGLHIAKAWIAGGYAEDIQDVAEAALRLYALMA
jgi:AcrR family transcriptional regulator